MIPGYSKTTAIERLKKIRGDIIEHALQENNLTKSALAEKAGISRQTLFSYINGKSQNISTLTKIAEALHIDVYILTRIQGEAFEQEATREGSKESLSAAEKNRFREIIEKVLKVAAKLDLTAKDIIEGLIYLRKSWVFKYRKHTNRNYSSFIGDVTYPDNTPVFVNQVFEKKWAVQNTGEKPWCNVELVCIDEEPDIRHKGDDRYLALNNRLIPVKRKVKIPDTMPGEPAMLTVAFIAPPLPCTALSHWKMMDKDGNLLLPDQKPVYCKVTVINI